MREIENVTRPRAPIFLYTAQAMCFTTGNSAPLQVVKDSIKPKIICNYIALTMSCPIQGDFTPQCSFREN
jgi:hypothetical protein